MVGERRLEKPLPKNMSFFPAVEKERLRTIH